MIAPDQRHLIHQVNYLLAVIQTQVATARAADSRVAAMKALDYISTAAERLHREVEERRRQSEAD